MKKLLFILPLILSVTLNAESLRMRSGIIVSGSILDQNEYVLNLSTPHGTLTLSQRDILEIMPDKHKISLIGGGELVGIITDITEFNIRLQTDQGPVNIDVPKVANIELFDYGQAERQQKFAEENLRAQQEALLPKEPPPPGTLVFDEGLEKAFGMKNPSLEQMPVERIVRRNADGEIIADALPASRAPSVTTPAPAAPPRSAPSPSTVAAITGPKIYMDDVPKDAKFNEEIGTSREKSLSGKVETNVAEGQNIKRYFSVELGAADMALKYEDYDIGGIAPRVGIKHLWRVGKSRLFLGPEIGVNALPSGEFEDGTVTAETSGYALDLSVLANYFFIEGEKYSSYITAGAGFGTMSMNVKRSDSAADPLKDPPMPTEKISASNFIFGAGLGVERKVSDLYLGLEAKAWTMPKGDKLDNSSAFVYGLLIKASWRL